MDCLVIGASARAAAGSLRRAGADPIAFDLYGDVDLAAVARSTRLDPADYPARLADRVAHLAPVPWIYTGALENHPAAVAAVARRFPLLGNDAATLRRVKDPFEVARAVDAAGLSTPAVRRDPAGLPADGSWLAKPFASGGGEGIRPWHGGVAPDPGRMFFQARVAGAACSALYVGDGRAARLAGVTRQYLGRPGNRFAYRGSLAPWPVAAPARLALDDLGHALAGAFGLAGIFGVDFVLAGDRPWPIEVNPRYTAAVEVLEYASGRSIMAEHLRACGAAVADGGRGAATPAGPPVVAKAILFARQAGRLAGPIAVGPPAGAIPQAADIPAAGTEFAPGHPILTVFAHGATPDACRRSLARTLRRRRAEVDRLVVPVRPGC